MSGNVHDMTPAPAARSVDLLICFIIAQQPIPLAPSCFLRSDLRRAELQMTKS